MDQKEHPAMSAEKSIEDAKELEKFIDKYYTCQLAQRDNIIKMLEHNIKVLEKNGTKTE